jgi:hypothetical protein
VTANTTHLAEAITLETFESKETELARDLAERIHNLRNNKNSQNKSGSNPGKPARTTPQRMTFNPLHPSMELPPEQLIRLMGMHSQQMAIEARKNKGWKNQTIISTDRHRNSSRLNSDHPYDEESPQSFLRLTLLSLTLASVSAYFFMGKAFDIPGSLSNSQPVITQITPAAVTSTQTEIISKPIIEALPVVDRLPAVEANSDIEPTSDLIEELPGQEPEVSSILENVDSNLTGNIITPTTHTVELANDPTQIQEMDMSEINQAIDNNHAPVETTNPEMFEDAYPEDL